MTVAADVASYIETITPLYPKFATLWQNVIWTLEHRADQIGEPLAGTSHIAKVKLNADLPIVTLLFKLSEETVHIIECEFQFASR